MIQTGCHDHKDDVALITGTYEFKTAAARAITVVGGRAGGRMDRWTGGRADGRTDGSDRTPKLPTSL